ncbi:MAG: vanomycin resistance protein VanB, partial [Oscillochloris sp.]|nr:vanomycin resistance protein VanB [Oscillochloris sp.]
MPPRRRPRAARRSRTRTPLQKLFEWLLVVLTLGVLLTTLATATVLLGERDFAQRIYLNIRVRGLAIGGMSRDSARQAIERHYTTFLSSPVSISYGDTIWHPSATELGLRLDVNTAVDAALAIGRGDARADNLRTAAAVWSEGVDLPLGMIIDHSIMQNYLLSLASAVEQPPVNADVGLEGASIRVQPEVWGVQVMVDEMIADITAAAQGLESQPVVLRTRTLEPRVRDSDIASTVERLHILLDGPILLASPSSHCAPGCSWEIPTVQIARWISLRHTTDADSRPTVMVQVDQGAIRN